MACIMWTKSTFQKTGYSLLSYGIILGIWQVMTFYFSPLVVPSISSVVECLVEIITNSRLYEMIFVTTQRLIFGLSLGIILGLVIGLLMGGNLFFRKILYPIINMFQTVPPVSWVVLALVWFGFNGKPVIFIVITTTVPIMAINISEGINMIDQSLMKMAKIYQFSRIKTFKHITMPSIIPHFKTGLQLALGSGWKIAVMGEVLTTSNGIGGMIKTARVNIEPEYVVAWSIVTVCLFHLSNLVLGIKLPRK